MTVIVIGAGPAGMMASISAAKENHKVVLLESNERLGKKLYITGKGRCNVTNAKDISEFFDYIPGNPYFLYSALYSYTNEQVIDFFEKGGTKLKVERGDRVFPVSDKSSDVIKVLSNSLNENKVKIMLNSKVKDIIVNNNKVESVVLENGKTINGDHFIICTGGASYPLTGSQGDGYKFAKKAGHKVISIKPSLVPIETKESWSKELMGLSLRNVGFKIYEGKKKVYSNQGEMIFTHFGVSGPIVLSGSRFIKENKEYEISIDLKPALDEKELDKRVQKDFQKYLNKDYKNSLDDLLPKKLIPIIIKLSGIPEDKKVNSITREERRKLVSLLRDLRLKVKGLRPIAEAIVTAGGVDINEIDPSTMKSKIVNNLSFAGEVMDVDAFTGGYNVQIALSTGYLAGSKITN